jgi:hypothetical protein
MKRKMCISLLALAVLFAFAQMAMAYTITTGSTWGPYQSGSGGEFTVKPGGGLPLGGYVDGVTKNVTGYPGTLQTFCLENDEYIALNTTYQAALNTAAVLGGSGGPSPDPISMGTAYLFSQFARGTLSGYNYGASRTTSAGALQNAIWMLEGEITFNATNTYIQYLSSTLGWTQSYMLSDSGGAYGVRALNLTLNGAVSQDLLTLVPIPAAAWLFGSGLVGLVAIRRRFNA